jgi:hypothetical protein
LLALAALQQSNWNEQMSDEMRVAKLQSDMASDLASIKSHLERANQNPTRFPALNVELQAFMEKYGNVPELEGVTAAVSEIADAVERKIPGPTDFTGTPSADPAAQQYVAGIRGSGVPHGSAHPSAPQQIERFQQRQVDNWLDTLTNKLDACGTNDQLRMIHIKQLNDNINNNSSMVSGIIESRNNATSSIINNLA